MHFWIAHEGICICLHKCDDFWLKSVSTLILESQRGAALFLDSEDACRKLWELEKIAGARVDFAEFLDDT